MSKRIRAAPGACTAVVSFRMASESADIWSRTTESLAHIGFSHDGHLTGRAALPVNGQMVTVWHSEHSNQIA